MPRIDNGTELTSKAMQLWSEDHCVELLFIQPGKPTQNAFIESFNARVREELLNAHWFRTLAEARATAATWMHDYNTTHSHSSLGHHTPEEFLGSTKSANSHKNRWLHDGADPTPIDKHGTLLDPAVFSRAARRAAERAGIGAAGPHALRHTAATQMLVLGVHPKVVADRLGHSTTRMTMDVYSHVVPALESDAANKVDGALRDILGQQMSAISQSVEDDAAKSKNRKCLRRKGFRWWAREVSNL